MPASGRDWEYDGRHSMVTGFSDVATRDGYGWELEDVAPAPGRGQVFEAFYDETTRELTFTSCTERARPLALVERFVREARLEVRRPSITRRHGEPGRARAQDRSGEVAARRPSCGPHTSRLSCGAHAPFEMMRRGSGDRTR